MHKEDSVASCLAGNDASHFDKSLQELRDFSSQLHQTAEHCEATFLAAEDKRIILENTKQYISRAVVGTVEYLSSISADLESCLSHSQTTSISQTNRKIDLLKTRIVACQQRSQNLALHKFYLTTEFSKHHCRYILPSSTVHEAMNAATIDGIEDEFETDEPLFLHTHNCKPTLVENENSNKNNVFSLPVLPVRGDGLSILPNSKQSVFQFKEALKLKRGVINWKALNSREMASIIKRGRRILA